MPSRDHLPHRANFRWVAVLLFALGACGLEPKNEPNLRVVGPPALVRPASPGPIATSTTIKTEIGDAMIISTRPTDQQLAPDPDAETVEADPVEIHSETTTEEAVAETTTTVAPTTTTTEIPALTTTTTIPPSTTVAPTTTTEVATTVVPVTTSAPGTTTTEPSTSSTAATTTLVPTSSIVAKPAALADGERRATVAFATAQTYANGCLTDPTTCNAALLSSSFSGSALAEVTSMVAGLTRSNLYVRIAAGDGYVLQSAAINNDATRASLSGCFTTVRNTLDASGQLMTASFESSRVAYEMTQVDGRWTVATHRGIGAC